MADRESLEREVEVLRQRVADLQRKLGLFTGSDVGTEQRGSLQVSLAEREELLLEAERVTGLGTWVWDLENERVYWSEGLFRILGYDSEQDQASGEAFFAAVHPEDREQLQRLSEQGRTTGVAQQVDYRILRRDGSIAFASMNATFLFDEAGKLRRMVGTVLDTTEVRALQDKLALAEKMEAIGRLAAGVAHDFNNVLMVVRGNLELLQLPDVHGTWQVFSALESASELTARLLTLGRKSPLSRRVVDLNQLVHKTLGLMDRLLREQFTLRVHVTERPVYVNVDATLIEQALVNLLLNAGEALPEGGRVDVTVGIVEVEDGELAELTVQDDGPGMDAAVRARVFEPFFTTKTESTGHGLGLAMVHGSVAQHGGQVSVESAKGQGTTFRLRLPISTAQQETPRRRISTLPPPARTCCSVLVVEDQETVGQAIRQLLEHLGHTATLVSSGTRALEIMKEHTFDVLLCDVMMPEMRGPALVERIRQTMPETTHRVVFMTGNSSDQVESLSDVGLLPKPFTLRQLDETIARAFAARPRASSVPAS